MWSTGPEQTWDCPAAYLFRFLANHGLLSPGGSLRWLTVTSGSRRYVDRAAEHLSAVKQGTPVRAISRHPDGVEVYHFAVAVEGEPAADIVYVCDATAHACCEVATRIPEDDDPSACHVFTAMVAYAFDDGFHTRVADGEAFAGLAADECFTGGRAIEGYVADDAVLFGDEACVL